MLYACIACILILACTTHSIFASLYMPASMQIEGGQVYIHRIKGGYRTSYPNGNQLYAFAGNHRIKERLLTLYVLQEPNRSPQYFTQPVEIFLALHRYYHKYAEHPELTQQ